MLSSSPASSRVVLVTGANQGIGYEVVRQLAQQGGHTVYLGARSMTRVKRLYAIESLALPKTIESREAKLHSEGLTTVRLLVIDVTSEDSVNAAAQKFASEHAHLDVLVNNAGIAPESHTHDASAPDLELIHTVFETNFFGVIRVTTAFVPLLRQSSNPVILNISSGLGSMTRQAGAMKDKPAGVQLPGYNSSKSALNAYTIALGASFPEARVNVISPGYVATRMNKYKGQLSPEESAAGVIRFGILLDQSGPTTSFLDHSGSVWPWWF